MVPNKPQISVNNDNDGDGGIGWGYKLNSVMNDHENSLVHMTLTKACLRLVRWPPFILLLTTGYKYNVMVFFYENCLLMYF